MHAWDCTKTRLWNAQCPYLCPLSSVWCATEQRPANLCRRCAFPAKQDRPWPGSLSCSPLSPTRPLQRRCGPASTPREGSAARRLRSSGGTVKLPCFAARFVTSPACRLPASLSRLMFRYLEFASGFYVGDHEEWPMGGEGPRAALHRDHAGRHAQRSHGLDARNIGRCGECIATAGASPGFGTCECWLWSGLATATGMLRSPPAGSSPAALS